MLGQELLAPEQQSRADQSRVDQATLDQAIVHLDKALTVENDNPDAFFFLAQAYDAKGDAGRARLCTAEENFYLGQMRDARAFAMRARETLARDSSEYRRATDIVLALPAHAPRR